MARADLVRQFAGADGHGGASIGDAAGRERRVADV